MKLNGEITYMWRAVVVAAEPVESDRPQIDQTRAQVGLGDWRYYAHVGGGL